MKTQPPPEGTTDEITSVKTKRKSGRTVSFIVSVIVHALIIGAATYVVTTVQQPRHEEFKSGPPITAKPVVRAVKQDPVSERREEGAAAMVQRVMTDTPSVVTMPDMPDNSSSPDGLPGATGSGLGGMGSGSELPSATTAQGRGDFVPMFGVKEGGGTAGLLKGWFYDFKQMRDRKMNAELAKRGPVVGDGYGGNELVVARLELGKFIKAGWTSGVLDKFFKAPEPLYISHVFIPKMSANQAPKEFGVENIVQPRAWLVRYKGRISPPSDGVYRFVGFCDDFMFVRLDTRVVLDGSLSQLVSGFGAEESKKSQYVYTDDPCAGKVLVGRRMEMKAGNYYDIDIMIGEGPGGFFNAYLLYQKEGDTYDMDATGNPILPVFRLDDSPIPESREIPFRKDSPVWRSQDISKS